MLAIPIGASEHDGDRDDDQDCHRQVIPRLVDAGAHELRGYEERCDDEGAGRDQYQAELVAAAPVRTRDRLAGSGLAFDESITTLPPLGFPDYVARQKHAFCTISDSGTITEESSLVGFPAITVRKAHERPEEMDEGVLVMSGLDPAPVTEAVGLARIILSYTDYVNRLVWHEG